MEPTSPHSEHRTRHIARIAVGSMGLLALTLFFMISDMSGQRFQSKFTISPDGTPVQEAKLKTAKKTFTVGEMVSARLDYEGKVTTLPCTIEGASGPVPGTTCSLDLEKGKAPHVRWTATVAGKYRFKVQLAGTSIYSNRFTVKMPAVSTVPTSTTY